MSPARAGPAQEVWPGVMLLLYDASSALKCGMPHLRDSLAVQARLLLQSPGRIFFFILVLKKGMEMSELDRL